MPEIDLGMPDADGALESGGSGYLGCAQPSYPAPSAPPCEGCCSCGCTSAQTNVAFGNGAVHYQPTFVSARGFGWTLAHVLSYSNQLSEDFDFSNGFNWVVASQPFLVELPDAVVALVLNGHKSVRFAFDGSNWNAQHGAGCHGHLARAICHEPLSRNCSPLVSSLPKSLPLARFIHRQSGFWRNLLQRLLFRPAYPKHPVFERQRLRGETQAIGNA